MAHAHAWHSKPISLHSCWASRHPACSCAAHAHVAAPGSWLAGPLCCFMMWLCVCTHILLYCLWTLPVNMYSHLYSIFILYSPTWTGAVLNRGLVRRRSKSEWQDLHDDDKSCMQSSYWELILENGQWLRCWITDGLCALPVTHRLNWNSWIWIPFPIDSDCTLLCTQVDKTRYSSIASGNNCIVQLCKCVSLYL
jgi:hypothetical protein